MPEAQADIGADLLDMLVGIARHDPAAGRAIERQGIGVSARGTLKTAPRGYPADHARIRLLRYKGITAWHQWPAESWLETVVARDRVAGFLRTTRPLSSWLDTYVGAPAVHETR